MIINQQQFNADGTWFKPGMASFVDVILSGASARYPNGGSRGSGLGQLIAQRYPARDLPAEVRVTIGELDGYAIIITHKGEPTIEYAAAPHCRTHLEARSDCPDCERERHAA